MSGVSLGDYMIEIVGIRNVQYTSKTGEPKHGVSLSVTEVYTAGHGQGSRAYEVYIANAYPEDFTLGPATAINYDYNPLTKNARAIGVLY